MQYKMFWVIFAASLSAAAAIIPNLYGARSWIVAAAVAAIGIIVMILAGWAVRYATMFCHLRSTQKTLVTSLCRTAIGAHMLWTLACIFQPAGWYYWAPALACISVATYWGSRGIEYHLSRAKPVQVTVQPTVDTVPGDHKVIDKFRGDLNTAGHPSVSILKHETVTDDNGNVTANRFLLQAPPTGR